MLSLGATTLCLLTLIGPLVAPSHLLIYHFSGSASFIFLSILLNVFAFWLLLTVLLVWAQRPGWPRIVIWSGLTLGMPWILLKGFAVLAVRPMPHALSVSVFAACLITFVFFLFFWRPTFLPLFERTQYFVATLFGFAALSGLLVLGQLLWFAGPFAQCSAPPARASIGIFLPPYKDKSRLVVTRRTLLSTGLRTAFSRFEA